MSITTTTAASLDINQPPQPAEKEKSRMIRFQRRLSIVKRGLSSSQRTPSPVQSKAAILTSTPKRPIGDQDRFILSMSEAFAPKSRNPNIQSLNKLRRTDSGQDRPDSGEDAFFKIQLLKGQHKGKIALGVADGVGGWADINVDPSEYSYRLCKNMEQRFRELERDDNEDEEAVSAQGLLKHSYDLLKDKKQVEAGSSTGCVGVVDPKQGSMHVANLGDSGYLIFRQGRLLRQSKPQTHIFNTPYQMAIIPDYLKVDENQRIDDKPEDADLTEHELEHGDVIVFATDGLTDNMFVHETLDIVKEVMLRNASWVKKNDVIEPGKEMNGSDELASALVKRAAHLSLDVRRNSPFTHELRRTLKIELYGGKPDDITVVVMLVQKAQ